MIPLIQTARWALTSYHQPRGKCDHALSSGTSVPSLACLLVMLILTSTTEVAQHYLPVERLEVAQKEVATDYQAVGKLEEQQKS